LFQSILPMNNPYCGNSSYGIHLGRNKFVFNNCFNNVLDLSPQSPGDFYIAFRLCFNNIICVCTFKPSTTYIFCCQKLLMPKVSFSRKKNTYGFCNYCVDAFTLTILQVVLVRTEELV